MKLSLRQCDPDLLQRVPRSWWMRLAFPRRHLYYCRFCRETMLAKPLPHAPDSRPRAHAGPDPQP